MKSGAALEQILAQTPNPQTPMQVGRAKTVLHRAQGFGHQVTVTGASFATLPWKRR